MSPKSKVVTFRPDDHVFAAMDALRERDGIGYSEQIRRALQGWLESKGTLEKTAKRRAGTRRQAR